MTFHRKLGLELTVTLAVFLYQLPDMIVYQAGYPLNHVKGIHNGDCIGKIFLYISDIGLVHVRNKVFYS
jgi:hypothetical protein